MKGLFCSAKYVKQRSIMDGALDPDKLLNFIEVAQDIHVQNYLGTPLYDKILDLVVNDTIGDVGNEVYNTLLTDYIKPMLAWYAQSDYFYFAPYTVSNSGVYKHSSENSETAIKDEVDALAQRAKNNAIHYTNRLVDYLCDNSSSYPEYSQSTTDGMSPDKDVNTIGWVL